MEIVKGFKEYTGEEAAKRQKIKGVIANVFRLYGFELSETPIIEYEEFVRGDDAASDDEAVSDVFRLEDRGKRKLALRYEFTFQLKRIASNKKLPFKRYQIGEVFRDEPATGNRFRQFTQCDADIVGSGIKDEAEMLAIASEILGVLGIKAEINVNSRKLLDDILAGEGLKQENRNDIIREIDKLDKLSEKEVRDNLRKYKAEKILDIFQKPKSYFEKYKAYADIKELEKYCGLYGVEVKFQPSLARGLSYYNGSVFEIKTQKMKETICGGGSYMVNGVQSTGISFGLERLTQLAEIEADDRKALVISIGRDKEALELAAKLRKTGVPCSIMYGKLSKSLEYANAYKIPYVIFIGEEEIKKKKLLLRNMKTGKEELISDKQLVEKLE